MFLRQLDLTTALRPSLLPEEALLFVQDAVGLYRDKWKIDAYQNGHAYLTSHRICYVDNTEPRKNSIAIDLKDVDHPEFYAGFLKSSPKITLYPKVPKRQSLAVRTPVSNYASSDSTPLSQSPSRYGTPPRTATASPAPPRDTSATWICPICSFSNPVPSNFDPSIANAHTPLPPCLACGIKPPLVHVVKAAIAAMSDRSSAATKEAPNQSPWPPLRDSSLNSGLIADGSPKPTPNKSAYTECPRCTFRNHPSLHTCEICGAALPSSEPRSAAKLDTSINRTDSPGPSTPGPFSLPETGIEIIKLSFRSGGEKIFHDRLREALIQRKWLLQDAPSIPRPQTGMDPSSTTTEYASPAPTTTPQRKNIGIAALEHRDLSIRTSNASVLGSAFSDLEALMTSAKEVIALAERFSASSASSVGSGSMPPSAQALLNDSVSALGLTTTRDMLAPGSSSAETLYTTQLARDLAEFLTDDKFGILRREGGIISLVDLWAVFNRRRNGIELVSPADFEKAVMLWEGLALPVRLRRFRSGVLVVQGRERTDEKTVSALLGWLADIKGRGPGVGAAGNSIAAAVLATGAAGLDAERQGHAVMSWTWDLFGRGVTAQETAERFGWSLGVAIEELEMAEDKGVLVREQDAQGVRFWENYFDKVDVLTTTTTITQGAN